MIVVNETWDHVSVVPSANGPKTCYVGYEANIWTALDLAAVEAMGVSERGRNARITAWDSGRIVHQAQRVER